MEDKCKKYVFLEQSHRGIMPCAIAVNYFLGVLCATIGVSCSTKCRINSNQNSLFKQNTKISTYTVILNLTKTPFITLAQIIA